MHSTPRHSRYCALLCGLLLTAAAACGKGDAGPADAEFANMDADSDGKLSPAEHAAGAQRMFAAMDADSDGKVTAAEMDAAHTKVTGKPADAKDMPASEKIKAVDGDGDGVLTADEHASGSRRMFEAMDSDRDGFVGKAELAAGHAKRMGKGA